VIDLDAAAALRAAGGIDPAGPGAGATHDELRAWCKERLTGYKVPRAFYLVDELPKSMLGKVLRAKVRDAVALATPLPRA
jgi:long-chain acyl-CoA synthetase